MNAEIYNTYCTEPDCINSRNALFFYQTDHYHVKNKHDVKILHHITVGNVLQQLPHHQQNLLINDKNQLLKRIEGYIAQFCANLNSFIIQKYLNPFLAVAKTEISKINLSDGDYVYRKLQQGDHQILKEYISCIENRSDNNYPFYGLTQNKIKQIDQVIAKEIVDLYAAFQKIIAVTFERREDFLKVVEGQCDTVSDLGKEEIRKTFKIDDFSLKRKNVKPKAVQTLNFVVESSNDGVENSNNSPEVRTKNRKIKQICKAEKKIKTHLLDKKGEEKKIHRYKDVTSQITQVAPDQIRIDTCSYGELTFEYIIRHYKDLVKIHIFHHKFARKEILKRLFAFYKNLKVVSLNCSHEFDSTVMPQNRQSLEMMESLQLKWDFDNFFKQFHILKFFPTKKRQNIQNLKRNNIELDLLLALKNNRSLTVNNERQIQELSNSQFRFENVKSLHFTKARQDTQRSVTSTPPFIKILSFNKLSQLSVLNLTEINLIDNEQHFGQFLKNNVSITTLVLSYCKISLTTVNTPVKIFQHLQELVNLKKFSFSPYHSQQYVKAENIFCLSNLEQMHLSNCNLVGINNKTYDDSSMLRGIKNLRKLTQLSLYACNPVFNDLFTYLEKTTLEKIQFLNIGYTQIDNRFATDFLPIMKRLDYLNIDSTTLDGKNLLKGFQTYSEINQKQSPLKYLSIQSTLHPYHFDTEEIKALSAYIPNLVYIQISNCKSLREYGFEDYKCLKYLAVDKEQQFYLQKIISSNVEIINLKD